MSAETSPRSRRGFYQKHEAVILGGSAVVVILGIWQAFWSAGKISPLFMSGPSAIVRQFHELWVRGTLLSDLAYSGRNFAVGFAMALAAGVVLGIIVGWYRRVRLLADPFLNALFATPRVAMVPLIIIWFGVGMWSKVFIVFLSAFFPILVNTVGGSMYGPKLGWEYTPEELQANGGFRGAWVDVQDSAASGELSGSGNAGLRFVSQLQQQVAVGFLEPCDVILVEMIDPIA